MREQLHIRTYDSKPTDLAAEMRDWREFVAGEGCSVRLRDGDAEVVVWMSDAPDDFPTVIVEGNSNCPLLDKVLGRVIHALSAHSDSLMSHDGNRRTTEGM